MLWWWDNVKKNVYKWYKDFAEGRETVEDESRPGRPSTSINEENINKIKDLLLHNRRLSIRDIADTYDWNFIGINTINFEEWSVFVSCIFSSCSKIKYSKIKM